METNLTVAKKPYVENENGTFTCQNCSKVVQNLGFMHIHYKMEHPDEVCEPAAASDDKEQNKSTVARQTTDRIGELTFSLKQTERSLQRVKNEFMRVVQGNIDSH